MTEHLHSWPGVIFAESTFTALHRIPPNLTFIRFLELIIVLETQHGSRTGQHFCFGCRMSRRKDVIPGTSNPTPMFPPVSYISACSELTGWCCRPMTYRMKPPRKQHDDTDNDRDTFWVLSARPQFTRRYRTQSEDTW